MPKKPFASPVLTRLESSADVLAFADQAGATPRQRRELEKLLRDLPPGKHDS